MSKDLKLRDSDLWDCQKCELPHSKKSQRSDKKLKGGSTAAIIANTHGSRKLLLVKFVPDRTNNFSCE